LGILQTSSLPIVFLNKTFFLKELLYTIRTSRCEAVIFCHASEGWHPGLNKKLWMPAFAGMTKNDSFAF